MPTRLQATKAELRAAEQAKIATKAAKRILVSNLHLQLEGLKQKSQDGKLAHGVISRLIQSTNDSVSPNMHISWFDLCHYANLVKKNFTNS